MTSAPQEADEVREARERVLENVYDREPDSVAVGAALDAFERAVEARGETAWNAQYRRAAELAVEITAEAERKLITCEARLSRLEAAARDVVGDPSEATMVIDTWPETVLVRYEHLRALRAALKAGEGANG